LRVKSRFTFITTLYTVTIVIYYDSTDIIKLFYSHDKLTICTYTFA